ncbi:glycoside hydrolase family 1 protein [Sphingobium sp.]|uniref:glycoside hydrolase family 1 protein n=1 Tax=Sphingobium sp. TaxID=1912891 RepID=UPI003BB5976F
MPDTRSSFPVKRRELLIASAAAGLAHAPTATAATGKKERFPSGFLWGVATAGHQVEGNNLSSDTWVIEHVSPTSFTEPSGDACDTLHRWPLDMDIVRDLHLNTYRFSIEWARIEPEPGQFSLAMLDHYKAMIEGCRRRGLHPVVTFSHFTCPRWFAMQGGWTNPQAPALFARYCDKAARHLAQGIHSVVTLNEPNLMSLLRYKLPTQAFARNEAIMAAAAHATGSDHFVAQFIETSAQTDAMLPIMIAAHREARKAIKAVRSDLPIGFSLAMEDDQPYGMDSRIADKRARCYDAWLREARSNDFVGVQNYERARIDNKGQMKPPADAPLSTRGAEIYPASLAGAVRYAWQVAGVPILVTEHGIGTSDDRQRAALIPEALRHLKGAMGEGIPVIGYIHWSLLDNFEWIFGYEPKFGLVAVDRSTFKRSPKDSALILARIARANGL